MNLPGKCIWGALVLLVLPGWHVEAHALGPQPEEVITNPPVAMARGEAAEASGPTQEVAESPREASHRILEEIMAGDEFHQESTLRVPEFMRHFFEPEARETPARKPDLPWLKTLMSFLGSLLEVLLWFALVALMVYLGYRFRIWDFSGDRTVKREQTRPEMLMGLDLTAEAVSQDTLVAAREAWQEGRTRQAISQLYRGALINLMDDCDCQFYEGDTEALCLEEARRKAAPATSTYFEGLTRCWQELAYGHETLHADQFNRLVGEWNLVWQKPDNG